jgi:hypothetical protein
MHLDHSLKHGQFPDRESDSRLGLHSFAHRASDSPRERHVLLGFVNNHNHVDSALRNGPALLIGDTAEQARKQPVGTRWITRHSTTRELKYEGEPYEFIVHLSRLWP